MDVRNYFFNGESLGFNPWDPEKISKKSLFDSFAERATGPLTIEQRQSLAKEKFFSMLDRATTSNTLEFRHELLLPSDAKYICEYLKSKSNITTIILSNNYLRDEGALELAKVSQIKHLELDNCNITNKGVEGFIVNYSYLPFFSKKLY